LVTGSAPSDVVCWIVGRAGTLLRTTDGGGHWEKVVAPGAGEFTGIRATDALHATILDSAGQARFETTDGGVNWELVWE
ncbi:MAG: YCF48-related protein, partial [Acidobacteriota bacterium]|nr:YCF48-related protein [Acidobacteriota bacterium]